jgi:hypothetical protein
MTIDELNAEAAAGNVESESGSTPDAGVSEPASSTDYNLEEFLSILIALQSVQQWLSAAPTFVPQTFQEQIQFVYDGSTYSIYFYANNQWNQVANSGGGGGAVTSVNAGVGISVSSTTGAVTVSVNLTAGAGIGISGATITNNGVTSLIAGTGITLSGPTGAVTVSASGAGGGGSYASGVFQRALNAASGSQTIPHGLGTAPANVRLSWTLGTGNNFWGGVGTYNVNASISAYVASVSGSGANNAFASYTSSPFYICEIVDSAGAGLTATITVDATNIYLTWSLDGGGTAGTLNFLWEANT